MKRLFPFLWLLTFGLIGCTDGHREFAAYFPRITTPIAIEHFSSVGGRKFVGLWCVKAAEAKRLLLELDNFEKKQEESHLSSPEFPSWWPTDRALEKMDVFYRIDQGHDQFVWYDPISDRFYVQCFKSPTRR